MAKTTIDPARTPLKSSKANSVPVAPPLRMASSKTRRIAGSSSMPMPISRLMTYTTPAPISSQNEILTSWGTPLDPMACGCSDGYCA
ncbi:hypothetical protein AHiyo4_41590 [Arthrobacter sp. Hiyo4]|nr:hypothetical protein AHiyo4_41590 [Arthrobacter sp. Hiyo4]